MWDCWSCLRSAVAEAAGDRVLPVRLVGADGAEIAAVTQFLQTEASRAEAGARLLEAREQGWGGEIAGLEVSIAAAGHKLAAMDQMAARHQVTHLGMPDFRPSVGRSSGAGGGP